MKGVIRTIIPTEEMPLIKEIEYETIRDKETRQSLHDNKGSAIQQALLSIWDMCFNSL